MYVLINVNYFLIKDLCMKILFDHQIFDIIYGGAAKYFAMLINYMPKDSWETTSLYSSNEYIKAKNLFKTHKYLFRGQSRLVDVINRPYTNYCLRSKKFDVFHQTNFGTYCIKDLGNKPMVTTYHDSNLSTIDPHPKIVEMQKISLKRADSIICVSKNTKKDMMNIFNVDEKKVKVIYHGIEIPNMDLLPSRRIMDAPYILYVGRRSEYKNFRRFITVFSRIHKIYPDINIVCTSSDFSNVESELFSRLKISENLINVSANEQTMKLLYRDALFFIFPSFYEGFGMPILESWSCHCPVVLSNTSCFPEIAGDAGLFFNPEEDDDIYEKMLKMIEDEQLRIDMVRKGDVRVKRFSWKRCVDEHMEVYKSLIY